MEEIIKLLRPFAKLIAEEVIYLEAKQPKQESNIPSRKLSGIDGICEIYHCGRTQAQRLKNSGVLDRAITHISARRFLIDEQKALACMSRKEGSR